MSYRQLLLIEPKGDSTKYSSTHLSPDLVIRPVGELAEDLDYKKNIVCPLRNIEELASSLSFNVLTKKIRG